MYIYRESQIYISLYVIVYNLVVIKNIYIYFLKTDIKLVY